jgi:hypothetical protein
MEELRNSVVCENKNKFKSEIFGLLGFYKILNGFYLNIIK